MKQASPKTKYNFIFIVVFILICGVIFIVILKKSIVQTRDLEKPVPVVQLPTKSIKPKVQPLETKPSEMQPEMQVETKDRNEDGSPDIWLYYNEDKEHIQSVADRDFDGKPDYFRYLTNGKVDIEEGDVDLDGKIDTWAYFSEGVKIRAERDTNKDGKPDMFIYYEANKMVGLEKDTDFDGKIDETIGNIPAE